MRKSLYIFWFIVLLILLILTIPYFIKILSVVFLPKHVSVLRQLEIYKWCGIGGIFFVILRSAMKKNIKWIEIFSHELTHIIVALLFFRKIHSFRAEDRGGGVLTSGKNQIGLLPIALAPYCLPIFTYLLLSIRWMLDFHEVWIYDVLIGITICFHINCFRIQMSNLQPDINQYPLFLSYFYIVTMWLINISLIFPSFFPNMNGYNNNEYCYGIWSCIYRLLQSWWETIETILYFIL